MNADNTVFSGRGERILCAVLDQVTTFSRKTTESKFRPLHLFCHPEQQKDITPSEELDFAI